MPTGPTAEIERANPGAWAGFRWTKVERRGPILRPARPVAAAEGLYGIDLTAGCGLRCGFCHIRGSSFYPGDDRVLFDPRSSGRLEAELDAMEAAPRWVVLSPTSDPLPPHRTVRREAGRVVRVLLGRGVGVILMTRGRIGRIMVDRLAARPDLARVAVGLTSCDRALARRLEPSAASPGMRLRGLRRLAEAGVPVEARLEPLIPGLTDGPEVVRPLFEALAAAGVRRVVAHYLFQHPAMLGPFREVLRPTGLAEALADAFEGGPVFRLGSIGPTKHLPREAREAGLARLSAWGAEFGLDVVTGASQNPDLRRADAQGASPSGTRSRTRMRRPSSSAL